MFLLISSGDKFINIYVMCTFLVVTLFHTHSLKIKSKKEGEKHDNKRNYEENQYCQWLTYYVWTLLNLFDLIDFELGLSI